MRHPHPPLTSAPPAFDNAMKGMPAAAALLLRLSGAVGGGYAFTSAGVALASVALRQLGLPRSEAVVLSAMLGFVLYLLVLLWAFSVRSPVRLWVVLAGGTALSTILAVWLQ